MGWLTSSSSEPEDRKFLGGRLARLVADALPDPEWPAANFRAYANEGYGKNELVYACISEKATSGPEAPLRVYRRGAVHGEPLDSHPLRLLLENPNPLMTEFDLFELLFIHLDLAGNAWWEVVRDKAGRVAELWPLSPDRVRIFYAPGRKVSYGYIVEDGQKPVPVEAIHFRMPNPVDPLVGAAPMRAALRATALDNEATDFVKALLQNHAVPGTVVKMGSLQHALDEQTTERLKEKWRAAFGGRRRGEPAFLQAGMEVETLGLNLKDLEFPDLRSISESRICMSFGVPPVLVGAKVGLDRSTFTNYREARTSLWEETLMPAQRRIRDTIAKSLLPLVAPAAQGRPRAELRFDHSEVLALRESEHDRWQRATEAFRAGGLTINDYRREIGRAPVDGGDVFLIPSGVIATRDVAGETERINSVGPRGGAPADVAEPEEEAGAAPVLERKADDEHDDPLRRRHEAAHARELRSYYGARRRDVEATIGGKAAKVNREVWDAELAGRLERLGKATSDEAGREVDPEGFDPDRTAEWHHARARVVAKTMNDSLEERAREAIVDAEPRAAVAELFDKLDAGVAIAATTMVTALIGWGKTEAGRQVVHRGGSATKTWVVRSGNPRPSHAALNGVTVPVGEPFPNGMQWPGDPAGGADEVAGCACGVDIETEV